MRVWFWGGLPPALLYGLSSFQKKVEIFCVMSILTLPQFSPTSAISPIKTRAVLNAGLPHSGPAHRTRAECLLFGEINLFWPETEVKLLNVR